ncbi:hypothetical protein [Thermocoleostomius sinensis]|uniref:Uncharacterized protein n=1 Tax=Thermocoleostomius sinensis A174 TaxID=2016057 RepID=A0A9E9C3F1_9CYAN|nr:hypothetical protein [Thermocoleostomius sinensis]WAL58906.1 hypothetical protein OXH18_17235 [Thermocoleostomius sinensis A174]
MTPKERVNIFCKNESRVFLTLMINRRSAKVDGFKSLSEVGQLGHLLSHLISLIFGIGTTPSSMN